MYKPKQVSSALDKQAYGKVKYTGTTVPALSDYLIDIWEAQSHIDATGFISDMIVVDGCIDLVVDLITKEIGFYGSSETVFNMQTKLPVSCFGFRFKPGAFHALTKLEAHSTMGAILPLTEFDKDFNEDAFFDLDYDEKKEFLIKYFLELAKRKPSKSYIELFDRINIKKIQTVKDLSDFLALSPRQTHRVFMKNYGMPPLKVLSIIRFQHCLQELTSEHPSQENFEDGYYDQSHFINDFKKNIGLTPTDFFKNYRK